MLNPLYALQKEADGRYINDSELHFIDLYIASFSSRLSAYRKLQAAEIQIVQKVQDRVRQLDAGSIPANSQDTGNICQRDMLFVFRFSALALLLDDTRLLEENVLMWLQTIMRSFKDHQQRCDLTYQVMQEVIGDYLNPTEAALFRPILELDRQFLGIGAG